MSIKRLKIYRLNSVGDTIVEVLIAITVISAVLGGAFVSSNKSYTTTRQAQERGEALKVTEGHVERLKVAASNPASNIFNSSNFCVSDSLVVRTGITPSDFSTYPTPDCVKAPQGGVEYHIVVVRDTTVAPPNSTFFVRTSWYGLGSSEKEEVVITYRMYP